MPSELTRTRNSPWPGLLALLPLALVIASCEARPTEPEPADPAPEVLTSLPRALTTPEVRAIDGSNDFALRFLEEVVAHAEPGTNVFLSPFSMSVALGMLANGAGGETLEEIQAALGVGGLTIEEMNEAYRGLVELLTTLDSSVEVASANAVWSNLGFPIRESFLERVRDSFDAAAQELDFGDPITIEIINQWAEEQTNGLIDEVLEEISPGEVVFLMNAVYFNGLWTKRFDPTQTRNGAFRLEDGRTVQVPMMSQPEMPVLQMTDRSDGTQILEIPYGSRAFSMVLVVPTETDLTSLLETLTAERWNHWMGQLSAYDGWDVWDVTMPRFDLEYENEDLKELFGERMGMNVAMGDHPDYSEMSPTGIAVSRVLQSTRLKVDEDGTEAAAVSTIGGFTSAVDKTFLLDRPFLVAIRERLSGTLLFLGAVYDPQ